MNVDIVLLVFMLVAPLLFRFCDPPQAALIVFLGGWLVLPVGHYPAGAAQAEFPYWITGLALPSDMLLTKAWIAPLAAVLGALAFDRRTAQRWRPDWVDLPIALWCLWPLIQSAVVTSAAPPGWLASLYLAGCWGLPWWLGRVYFATPEAQRLLARGLAVSALACLPISLIEGVLGPVLYDAAYETHPFRLDGAARYIGFRPIGLFEHGNQFGLWIALCALAAAWLAWTEPAADAGRRRLIAAVAATVAAMAVLAQSIGAIVLMLLGAAVLGACRWLRPRALAVAVTALVTLGGAVYVSGVVPVMQLGRETVLGQRVVDSLRAVGRGSFGWRIAQDQKLMRDATAHPVAGLGRWDWWRSKGTRPWGFTLLALGQFGAIGLGACLAALLWPALRVAWHAPRGSGWQPAALPLMLACLVVLAVIDAMMNSFIFFPAVLIAGALAAAPRAQALGHAGFARVAPCV